MTETQKRSEQDKQRLSRGADLFRRWRAEKVKKNTTSAGAPVLPSVFAASEEAKTRILTAIDAAENNRDVATRNAVVAAEISRCDMFAAMLCRERIAQQDLSFAAAAATIEPTKSDNAVVAMLQTRLDDLEAENNALKEAVEVLTRHEAQLQEDNAALEEAVAGQTDAETALREERNTMEEALREMDAQLADSEHKHKRELEAAQQCMDALTKDLEAAKAAAEATHGKLDDAIAAQIDQLRA
eukprot:PhM_4_TR15708/c1_g1_i2/m.85091